MNRDLELISLVNEYAASFPFTPIDEQLVSQLALQLGGGLSPLLRQIYIQIGRGAYFMTIPFFDFDSDLKLTLDFRERLANVAGYKKTGKELIIGSALDEHLPGEPSVFFASDYSARDPDVYCMSTLEDKLLGVKSLSEIVTGLRGFPDCRNVPQGLFDYYWYKQHFQVPAAHNPVELSIQIIQWRMNGRIGMEERFQGHQVDGNEESCDMSSLFGASYYL